MNHIVTRTSHTDDNSQDLLHSPPPPHQGFCIGIYHLMGGWKVVYNCIVCRFV